MTDTTDGKHDTPPETPSGSSANGTSMRGSKRGRKPLVRKPLGKPGRGGIQLTRTPDYLVVGHICADLQPDGSYVLGGTALYSAIAAARLGARVAVLTRGVFGRKVAGMTIPSLDMLAEEEISIIVQEADLPTVFINEYQADRRVQTVPHWAGPIDLRGLPPHWRNAKVIHLGPVADEVDPRATSGLTARFLGITPQGWMRDWPRETGGKVKHIPLKLPGDLLSRIDCAIVSIEEIAYARDVVTEVGNRRLGVVTQGADGARIIAGGQRFELPGYNVPIRDLTGAGDVFAAAFFLKASDRTISADKAGRFANAVAGLSLGQVGAFGIPELSEFEEFLAR
ncbi:MAG: hypothetical protein AVDCRST_MAG87-657 [uncultured Thermomicrobiales bacterium]|uniref:Carbohydrate kinase PfkB domain-containing protein n=1 Tax=uncultured Thermomicrobiales bacterium TaxID=1645740 RepID=A0A6J4UIM3_9BACT|nr:MAG: hypothetical protein AVDCRST_MAG87-657 [uncultured Thermomicrobiales bacterium]